MSKLARTLAVAAMLAATSLAGLAATAQATPTDQPSGQADATVRRLLAKERSSIPNGEPAQAAAARRGLLAQERYYSTYGNTSAPAPVQPQPGRPAGWRTPALAVLAAVLALAAAVAVLAARRAHRGQRAEQAA
jgi:hypothetical protein